MAEGDVCLEDGQGGPPDQEASQPKDRHQLWDEHRESVQCTGMISARAPRCAKRCAVGPCSPSSKGTRDREKEQRAVR